jgi:acetyl esterase
VIIPPQLLEFQRTLRPPPGGSAADLLAAFDRYANLNPPAVAAVHERVLIREVAGWRVTADVYVPFGEPPFPVLVYFHGGAWTMGAPRTHRRLAAELASLGLLVANIDYRRAPKHRFPAAVEDAAHASAWVSERCELFGGDPSRILVGGDSAGANLAASVSASGAPVKLEAAILLYGIYDFYRALPALAYLVGGADARSQLYVPPEQFEALRDDPRLCPEHQCAEFPPTFLAVGEHDPLLPESLGLAAKLERHGVPHTLHVAAGAPHGFLQIPQLPACAIGLEALRRFLRELPG